MRQCLPLKGFNPDRSAEPSKNQPQGWFFDGIPDMNLEEILHSVERFVSWANRKISLHFRDRPEFYFHEREIWWASFGENVGSETNGKNFHFERPVVIVKKFSKDMLFVIPTTTKTRIGTWYQPIEYGDVKTQAILAQARTISAKRLIRKIGNLSPEQFRPLIEGFVALIKTNSPT